MRLEAFPDRFQRSLVRMATSAQQSDDGASLVRRKCCCCDDHVHTGFGGVVGGTVVGSVRMASRWTLPHWPYFKMSGAFMSRFAALTEDTSFAMSLRCA